MKNKIDKEKIRLADYEKRIERASEKIQGAEYILIGGAAGLSTAAGLDYGGERFRKNFSDYNKKYGITDMYSGMFYQFNTPEEKWAYRARQASLNRFEMGPTQLYKDLHTLVKEKNHFVQTTNGDHQFFLSGFHPEKIFATQGDYAELQCSKACHDTLYDNTSLIKEMKELTRDFKVPSHLVPFCPRCGEPMMLHLRIDRFFVENSDYRRNLARYQSYLKEIEKKQVVLLEIGVGFNTPGIIKYPFERLTHENEGYTLIRINKFHPQGSNENRNKTITFTEDVDKILTDLHQSVRGNLPKK